MKAILFTLTCLCGMLIGNRTKAQANEIAQLALNTEKLAQFKSILSDLKKGYQIVSKGYSTVKNLTEGNFNIHKVFLDGLMQVSPTVRKYKKIPGIINAQISIVTQYKQAFNQAKNSNMFNPSEIEYMGRVYGKLFNSSLRNLDELLNIITANQLRMNDAERLNAIDKIYSDMTDKLSFIHHFNNQTFLLSMSRANEQKEIHNLRALYPAP